MTKDCVASAKYEIVGQFKKSINSWINLEKMYDTINRLCKLKSSLPWIQFHIIISLNEGSPKYISLDSPINIVFM